MTAPLISPDDIAAEFGVSTKTVLEWRRAYNWPFVKVGNRIRFTEQQREQIIAMQSVRPTRKTTPTSVALPGQTKRSAAKRRSA